MVMKWMRWGWEQYLDAPDYVVDRILFWIKEEQEELERVRNQHGN